MYMRVERETAARAFKRAHLKILTHKVLVSGKKCGDNLLVFGSVKSTGGVNQDSPRAKIFR